MGRTNSVRINPKDNDGGVSHDCRIRDPETDPTYLDDEDTGRSFIKNKYGKTKYVFTMSSGLIPFTVPKNPFFDQDKWEEISVCTFHFF